MTTMPRNQDRLAATETTQLIAADKVEGTEVFNQAGEKLGTIESVMLDKFGGKVAYAVMSFGGFLGIGDRRHALPWPLLRYDTEMGGYVVNLEKKRLADAPSYDAGEAVNWDDRAWGRKVHDYYAVPPYWM
jgi:hypothetical protein